jgi:hypothetical protein
LTAASSTLQRALIKGWADAAVATASADATLICRWSARRLAHVDNLRSEIIVGHEDLAGWIK